MSEAVELLIGVVKVNSFPAHNSGRQSQRIE